MSEQSSPGGDPGNADDDIPNAAVGLGHPSLTPDFRERRRLDEVFGEILPNVTGDERHPEPADHAERERWYRENRPPHHG